MASADGDAIINHPIDLAWIERSVIGDLFHIRHREDHLSEGNRLKAMRKICEQRQAGLTAADAALLDFAVRLALTGSFELPTEVAESIATRIMEKVRGETR